MSRVTTTRCDIEVQRDCDCVRLNMEPAFSVINPVDYLMLINYIKRNIIQSLVSVPRHFILCGRQRFDIRSSLRTLTGSLDYHCKASRQQVLRYTPAIIIVAQGAAPRDRWRSHKAGGVILYFFHFATPHSVCTFAFASTKVHRLWTDWASV